LDAARVIRDVQSRNAALMALNRVAASAAAASALPDLFARGTEEIVAVIGCDAMAVYLLDDARREAMLAHLHLRAVPAALRSAIGRVPLGRTKLGLVACDGIPRVFHRDEYSEHARAMLDQFDLRIIVSVPLVSRGKVLGVMDAAYRSEHTVVAREIEL